MTLICILITSTILSHAAEDDEQAQIRMQLELFAQEKELWVIDAIPPSFYYAVYDLDGDGKLELLTSTIIGTGANSENHFYQTDLSRNQLIELKQEYYQDENELDILDINDEYAYRDENNIIYYLAADHRPYGAQSYDFLEGAFSIKDGIIYSMIYRHRQGYEDISDNTWEITWYDANGNEITETAWEQLSEEFLMGKEKLDYHISWKYIDTEELQTASWRKIYKELKASYREGN